MKKETLTRHTMVLLLGLWLGLSPMAWALDATPATLSEDGDTDHVSIRRLRVNCDKGHSLQRALDRRAERLVVEFKGTCSEEVIIDRDHTTLRGANPSALIVGSVTITGASNVVLENFSVRDAPNAGVFVLLNSGAKLDGLTIENSAIRGILLEGSAALIGNTTVVGGSSVGILIRTSRVEFFGSVHVSECGVAGISSTDGSVVLANPADLTVDNNFLGYVTQLSSETTIANGSLIANNNNLAGILIASHGMFVHGTAVIEANDNQVFGIWVDELSAWSPFVGFGAQVSANNNGADGVKVERTATMQFTNATTVENNAGKGITVDNATLVLGGTTVSGNGGGDIELTYGSHADFNGNTLATPLICDGTVMVRGDESCPAPRPATKERSSQLEKDGRLALARAMSQ